MIDENWVFLGAAFNLIGSTSYVILTIKGITRPNRVTWFLWALAPLIAFAAMLGEGVDIRLALMTFMVGFGPLMVFLASFVNKKSVWKLTRFDITCGILSLCGVIAWSLTRTGEVAIFFSLLADGLALLPTLVKGWRNPETENGLLFLLGTASAGITILALNTYDFTHLAFPVYIFISCLLLFLVIHFKLGKNFSLKRVDQHL
jgi:hypothetical protein